MTRVALYVRRRAQDTRGVLSEVQCACPMLRGLLQPVKFGSTHRLSLHLWKLRTESVGFAVCGDARKRKQKKQVGACGCHVEEVSTSR